MKQNVAVLGASPKPERYSHKAVALLKECGHTVFPIAARAEEILGVRCFKRLADIPEEIDTVSVYVNPARFEPLIDEVIARAPSRIIFSPATESPDLHRRLEDAGFEVLDACTLVMLRTDQF